MFKYEKGKIVTGHVTGVEKYGIFVNLDEFYSGLIHISEISDGFVKDINDYVNVGETIQAKIVEVDSDTYHVKLSIKNLNYRVNRKSGTKLKETSNGFMLLESNLPKWINEKLSSADEFSNNK